jgi:hypothetical protein
MEEGSSPISIDLHSDTMKQELMVELTRGQVSMIYQFLEKTIQPKGLDMIKFTADIFDRLEAVLRTSPEETFLGEKENGTSE